MYWIIRIVLQIVRTELQRERVKRYEENGLRRSADQDRRFALALERERWLREAHEVRLIRAGVIPHPGTVLQVNGPSARPAPVPTVKPSQPGPTAAPSGQVPTAQPAPASSSKPSATYLARAKVNRVATGDPWGIYVE